MNNAVREIQQRQMPSRRQKKKENRNAEIGILLITLAVSLAIVGLYLERHPRVAAGASIEGHLIGSQQVERVLTDEEKLEAQRAQALRDVNFYLKDADQRHELGKAQAQLNTQNLAVDRAMLDDLYYGFVPHDQRAQPIDIHQEPMPGQVMEDIRGYEVMKTKDDLQQPLNDYLAEQQDVEQYNRVYRQAYVQVYLEQMRAAGYDVTLSENLEIMEVKLIPGARGSAAVAGRGGPTSPFPPGYGQSRTSSLVDTSSGLIRGSK